MGINRKPKYHYGQDTVEINPGRDSVTIRVTNTGDRPVQVGSHFHFFEVNPAMRFERDESWGMHLDIPSGTGVRFEPGETKQVVLVAYAGARRLFGFNGLVNGGLDAPLTKAAGIRKLAERGFQNGAPNPKVGPGNSAGTKAGTPVQTSAGPKASGGPKASPSVNTTSAKNASKNSTASKSKKRSK